MSEVLFEQLENLGFIRGTQVLSDKVLGASPKVLVDAAIEAAAITAADQEAANPSIFRHAASLSLGGSRHPCSSVRCRKRRSFELARFSALYSDGVYIHNFLSDNQHALNEEGMYHPALRRKFFEDVQILASLRPLIEGGFILPVTAPNHSCPHCLAKEAFGSDADDRLEAESQRLRNQLKSEAQVTVERIGHSYRFHLRGPEQLVEHGEVGFGVDRVPDFLKENPGLLAKLRSGKKVVLSRDIVAKVPMCDRLVDELLQSIAFELALAQVLGTTFLTEREVHLEMLNAISEDPEIEKRNNIAVEHLTSFVPFAEDVPLESLLTLRQREEEAFLLYRRALNTAIEEYAAKPGEFDEKRARQLFADVLEPEIAHLDQKVRASKRDLTKKILTTATAWTGAISFGVYSGFLPAGLAAIASSLGFTKVIADASKSILDKSEHEADIRPERLFFLWKVKELARAHDASRLTNR